MHCDERFFYWKFTLCEILRLYLEIEKVIQHSVIIKKEFFFFYKLDRNMVEIVVQRLSFKFR